MTFETMKKEDLAAYVRHGTEAFADYEFYTIYFPEAKRRRGFLEAMLKSEFKTHMALPSVRFIAAKEDGKTLAITQLHTPDFAQPSDMAYLKAGILSAIIKGGIRDSIAWSNMEKKAFAPCEARSDKTWYLSSFSVRADLHRKGIGSRFLQEYLIPYVKDQQAEGLCLYTNSENNRKFYQNNGFTEFDERYFHYRGGKLGSWSYIIKF